MINQQTLELYVYVDGVNDIPFLSGEYEEYILVNGEQFITSDNKVFNVRMLNENIIIHAFTYNAQRMGGAPTISATINFPECLDELFSEKVYAVFNGEKYFLLATPSSSYSAESVMYKHDATFVSERIALENTYYYDVVAEDYDGDKPASNNSEFVFFGDIHEFAERMNYSLNYSGLDYTVVVDEGIESEEELLSVENKFFSEVLQEVYNVYELPYYFVGKTIHIGYTTNAISEVFRYGDSDALVSISKNNANSRVINRATGIGSEDNLPHYYPNTTPKGDIVAIANENNTSVTNDTIEIVNAIRYSEKIELGKEVKYVDWLSGTDISLEPRVDNTLAVSMYDDQKNVRVTTELLYEDRNKVEDRTLTWQLSMTLYHADYKNIPGKGQIKVKPIIRLNESSWANHAFDEVPTYSPKFELIVPNIATFEGEWGSSTQDGRICELKDGYFILPPIEEWLGVYNSQPKVRLTLSNLKIVCSTNAEYKLFTDWEIDKVGHWEYEGKEIDLEDCGIRILANATSGDSFYQSTKSYIQPQKKLMPPIYRESLGAERFYDAISDVYPIPDEQGQDSGLKYEFENEYNGNNPKEQIVQFEEIKPTIKEMTNSEGLRIDMFTEFAYDDDDNDETYEAEEGSMDYQHPLFFAKLRKLDFNLFEHAIDDGEMTIAMTNGKCGGCEFRVAVDADSKKNTVQVDENGNLVRDDNGNVLCGRPTQASVDEQDRQQDTINNEVWIALYKDKDTFGEIMPNATNDYRPTACTSATSNDGDTFVILHISLPQQYILAAEERLRQQIIQFIYDNNVEKFNFSVKFSRIYFAEHPEFLQLLDENARITIEYNEKTHLLYVSSISYKTTESDILPEVTVELKDEISVTQNSIQKATNQVKSDLYRTLAGIDVVAQGTQVFLRKDQPDTAKEQITFKQKPILQSGAILEDTISSKDYFEGIKGISINKDANNNWHIETDYLHARKKFSAKEVEIQKVYHIGGAQIKSSASLVCTRVDDIGSAYRCWFDTIDDDGNIINNEFVAGDQAYVQTFNLITDSDGNTTNHFYWRLVESVTADSIVLSKAECAEGSTIPMVGDHIVQLGYQGDDKPERQVAVIDAGAGEGAPYYRQYVGINSFALPEPETQLKPNDNILTGKVTIEDGSLLSGVVAIKDSENNVVTILNGSQDLLEDGRKVIIAAGVNNYNEGDTSVDAKTKILDDGTLIVNEKVGLSGIGEEDTDVRIWAGADESNKETAPFRVTQEGKVVATNADIAGVVNATSGTFENGVFNNVTVDGSFSSPFKGFGGSYIVVNDLGEQTTYTFVREFKSDTNNLYAWENDTYGSDYPIFTSTPTPDVGQNILDEEGNVLSFLYLLSYHNDIDGTNGIGRHDNIDMPIATYKSLAPDELSWDISNSGRLVRLTHAEYIGNSTYSDYVTIVAPDGKYFYENGDSFSAITITNQVVELLGYARNEEFLGWIVLNRKSLLTPTTLGVPLNVLFQCVIRENAVNKFDYPIYRMSSFGGIIVSPYLNPATSLLNIPFSPNTYRGLDDVNNWEAIVSNGIVKNKEAGIEDDGYRWIRLRLELDSSAENVLVQIISTADWTSLT